MRGSSTGRPVMAILDYLGRRWTLRIGWELRAGPLAFRELQRRCEIGSPNVLALRLREGAELGVFARDGAGQYGLTRSGRRLAAILGDLDGWAKGWSRTVDRAGRRTG